MGVTYWKWVKKEYGVSADEFPLKGDLGLFAPREKKCLNKDIRIFLTLDSVSKGVPNSTDYPESLGYRSYSVLFTTQKMIDENPELVQQVVDRLRVLLQSHPTSDPTRILFLVNPRK